MNKVFVLPPGENWICDRFVKEWTEDNSDITVSNPNDADVIWLLADWAWKNLAYALPGLLEQKKVITSVHHIVPEKFYNSKEAIDDFKARDRYTDIYHVYNKRATDFIKEFTDKPIIEIKYWANNKIWFPIGKTKQEIREKFGVPKDVYLIGSVQRDTEGHDLVSPKLEKGPDRFVEAVEKISKVKPNVHVLLGGWRRQYVIKELEKRRIPYTYLELPEQEVVNEMYQALDLYLVTARYEGGPQALIECGLTNTPCCTTPVGIAEQVLPQEAINHDVTLAKPKIPDVENWKLPHGYDGYRKLIESL